MTITCHKFSDFSCSHTSFDRPLRANCGQTDDREEGLLVSFAASDMLSITFFTFYNYSINESILHRLKNMCASKKARLVRLSPSKSSGNIRAIGS